MAPNTPNKRAAGGPSRRDRDDSRDRQNKPSGWDAKSTHVVERSAHRRENDDKRMKRSKHDDGKSKRGSSSGIAQAPPPKPVVVYSLSPSDSARPMHAHPGGRSSVFSESSHQAIEVPPADVEELLDFGDAFAGDEDSWFDGINPEDIPIDGEVAQQALLMHGSGISVLGDDNASHDNGDANDRKGKETAPQPQGDIDDQFSLSERARKLKGKDALQAPKQAEEKEGVCSLLERTKHLKERTEKHISNLISGGPRLILESIGSSYAEPVTSSELDLPMDTVPEECRARHMYTDLAALQAELRRTPIDKTKAIGLAKFMAGRVKEFGMTPPADLMLLVDRLNALVESLEGGPGGTGFEEKTLASAEDELRAHLGNLDAACSEVLAELKLVEGGRAGLVDHRRKIVSLRQKFTEQVATLEQKVKEAKKHEQEFRCLEEIASKDLEYYDDTLKSQTENIRKLTKRRDETRDHVKHVGDEKKRLKTKAPQEVIAILSYFRKPAGGVAPSGE